MVGVLHRDVGRCCKDPELSWDLWISCFYPKWCRQKYYQVTATQCSTMKLSQNNQSIADDKQCSGWRALRLKAIVERRNWQWAPGVQRTACRGNPESFYTSSRKCGESEKIFRAMPWLAWYRQVSTFSNVVWGVWWEETGAVHQPMFLALLCALCAAKVEFSQRAAECVDSFESKVTTGPAGMSRILPQTINEK